jgi:ribonuclease-3 family protein
VEAGLTSQACAYLGDAVYELCVREHLMNEAVRTVREYNRLAKRYVSAAGQYNIYHAVYGQLTEEEQAVMRRGRNLNPTTRAKNAEMSEYRHATGLEALFGYLYAAGRTGRIKEVFDLCVKATT